MQAAATKPKVGDRLDTDSKMQRRISVRCQMAF